MMDDSTLLHRYAETGSEADFTELVARYLNLVYSAALRQVNGDTHLAQDVAQQVFTDLARKATKLAGQRVLAGWLFTSTRFVAARMVRTARRRRVREQEAHRMNEVTSPDPAPALDWERIRPILDEALAELEAPDREAILLRYLGGCRFAEVGSRLELSENAARMRVERAIEKLRALLAKRGATSTAAALSLALASQATVTAPAGLAAAVTGAALSGGGAAAALSFMSLPKFQLLLAGVVLTTGTGYYAVQERTNAALRAELAAAQSHSAEIARLKLANRQLSLAAGRVADLRVTDAELARLREEVAAQRQKVPPMTRAVTHTPPATANPAPAGETRDIQALDARPKPVLMAGPVYPHEMAAAGVEGTVVVSFVVDSSGNVQDAKVVNSSRTEFEAAAVAAVAQWQFDPGRHGGRPVNTRVSQQVVFSLAGKGNPAQAPADWF